MKHRLISVALVAVFSMFLFTAWQHPNSPKKVYCTELNGDGCVCHTVVRSPWVQVWVEGPDTLRAGQSATYAMYLAKGPAKAGGYNIATRFGTLAILDTISVLLDNEITQRIPLVFPTIHDTIHWYFKYTAPLGKEKDTIYSCGISVNYDGEPSELDEWNYGPKFVVHLIEGSLPVELLAFNGLNFGSENRIQWTTAAETNIKSFTLERSKDGAEWEAVCILPAKNITARNTVYQYNDKLLHAELFRYYRLAGIDFSGKSELIRSISINTSVQRGYEIALKNYPNPFNPATKLSFSLPYQANLKITVYNPQGKKLLEEDLGSYSAGEHQYLFDATAYGSGIYFAVLSGNSGTQSFTKAIKMVCLK